MLQVAEWILRDPSDKTKVSLVFGNGEGADNQTGLLGAVFVQGVWLRALS